MNPAAQLHVYAVHAYVTVSDTREHCPPFWHGLLVHGFRIAEKDLFKG